VTILIGIADPTIGGVLAAAIPSLAIGVPVAWVAAMDLNRHHARLHERFIALLLPALAVLQAMHVYPIAGSQVAWATFLLVPVGAVCVARAWSDLQTVAIGRIAVGLATLLVVAAIGERFIHSLDAGRSAATRGTRVDVTGANSIRLPRDTATVLENVTRVLRANCSTFVTLPGMNSFYLFAGQRPPTGLNTTSWMYLLDSDEQLRVVRQLSSGSACVVTNVRLLSVWTQSRSIPRGPLTQFATSGLWVIAVYGDYAIAQKR
jgi:hypothetical protein